MGSGPDHDAFDLVERDRVGRPVVQLRRLRRRLAGDPLGVLEVALRNALHGQLTRCYGEAWYDNPAAGLDLGTLERIAKARTELARLGLVPTSSRVVAELSFGFWVALVGGGRRLDLSGRRADYELTLWRPALRRAFPHRAKLTRMAAHQALDPLRKLRNRIAHHEPIFARRLDEDHARILEVTGWMSPGARAWVERRTRVPRLLDASKQAAGPAPPFEGFVSAAARR